MNVIFNYNQTEQFTSPHQAIINSMQFSVVQGMKQISLLDANDVLLSQVIPFQANLLDEAQFDSLKAILEQYGIVDVIGKWNADGSQIYFEANKYRDALKNIETYEDAVFINSVDFTGKEEAFVPEINEDGNDIQAHYHRFVRVKTSKKPTLTQARKIQVVVFDKQMTRDLKNVQ